MGNSWLAHLQFDSSSSSPCSTGPSSPGIAQNTSNEGTHSGAGSAFSSRLDEVFPNGQILPTPNLRTFTFAELKAATTNFSRDRILGEGRFGTVFKGWIDEKTFAPTEAGSGMAIAVKKMILGPIWARFSVSREDPWIPCSSPDSQRRPLNPMKQVQWIPCSWPGSERRPFDPMKQVEWPERLQGREEWLSEVNILGSLSHPNIVRLLGHCWEDEEVLLVHEFMPRGSLENHLFSRGSAFRSLSWSIRLKIAIGAARGVSFLHSSERKTIYRSFRPSDILLDLNYNAKISNFGLARNGEDSHVEETCVMGGSGYEPPEDEPTGHLYVKSDVYNFGVVLLEMLSGMRAVDSRRPSWQHNLVVWAKPYLSGAREVLSRVMDPRLEGQYPSEGAVQAAQLILKCLGSDPRRRPSMSEVVETLEQISSKKKKKIWSRFRPRTKEQSSASH